MSFGTRLKRAAGPTALVLAGTASLAATAFWPGVACNSNAEVDAARQAREQALGRHRLEAISNFIETQRKIQRRREFRRKKAEADKRAKTATPAQRSAFRASAVLGIWQRYVAAPSSKAKGRLGKQQAGLAALAVKRLQPRVDALESSAKQAKLDALAAAAASLNSVLPSIQTGIGDGTVEPELFAKAQDAIKRIEAAAREAKLPVLPQVPTDFGATG